jgi:hypothetical protein
MDSSGYKAYYVNLKFFKGRLVTKHSKLKLYRTVKCLRNLGSERIDNPEIVIIREKNSKKNIWAHEKNQIWRIKTNEELDKLISSKTELVRSCTKNARHQNSQEDIQMEFPNQKITRKTQVQMRG